MVASRGIPGPLAVLVPKVQKVALRPRFLKGPAKSGEFPFGVGFHFLPFVYVYGLFRGLRASAAVRNGKIISSSIHRLVGLHLAAGRDARIFEVPQGSQGWMVASGGIPGPLAVLA